MAARTRYVVPGWGVGELWTSESALLAHEIRYTADVELASTIRDGATVVDTRPRQGGIEDVGVRPLKGAASPPTGTLLAVPSPVEHVSVSTSCRGNGFAAGSGLDAHALVARFAAFLGGADERFDDVALDLDGYTPFQRAVAAALRTVRRGDVVSYSELAALAGYPRAQRAVGTFCARNPFALVLPCHRVVGAHGIGGYGSAGVGVKRRLLALEGVVL